VVCVVLIQDASVCRTSARWPGDRIDAGLHRAICPAAVTVSGDLQPRLGPPAPSRRLGGKHYDPEACPPELAEAETVELPEDIEAATTILREHGQSIDPHRVDAYQLGVLLYRMTVGIVSRTGNRT